MSQNKKKAIDIDNTHNTNIRITITLDRTHKQSAL